MEQEEDKDSDQESNRNNQKEDSADEVEKRRKKKRKKKKKQSSDGIWVYILYSPCIKCWDGSSTHSMMTVYVDLDDTDSGRDISIRETDVR